jgi:iron complex transport system substrate-binding protein
MRDFALLSAIRLLALAMLALAAAPAEAAPRRVASLNLCTDELLLQLAAPGQIVSVTHLAQQEAETPLWRRASLHARNDGTLLSVVGLRPDLVLTMGGGGRDRLRIAARLGIPTLDLPFAQSLGDVVRSIARVAAALGRPGAGTALLNRMRAVIESAPPARQDAIWLGGGGRTVAATGLEAQWMALAGLRQRPMQGDRVSLETLLVRPPGILLRSDYRQGQYSSGQRWLVHPLARALRAGRVLPTDGRLWTCMGPLLIDEIYRLRREAGR